MDHLKELDRQVGQVEAQIKAWHCSSELRQKLEKISGIGPLGASALVASIADARSFDNGRQVSAWIGLVPRQHSSGGKPNRHYWGLVSAVTFICARCPFHGVRFAIVAAQRKATVNPWLAGLLHRRNPNVTAVALANKNARTVSALLAHDREIRPDYVPELLEHIAAQSRICPVADILVCESSLRNYATFRPFQNCELRNPVSIVHLDDLCSVTGHDFPPNLPVSGLRVAVVCAR